MSTSERFLCIPMNKSFLTNMLAALLVGLSYCVQDTHLRTQLSNVGFYALSCALTNWIAIIMLFDKVPFLYGSGVILEHFAEFKKGIKELVMQEFFTQKNVSAVISTVTLDKKNWDEVADALDYDKIYDALVDGILESKFGKMIVMMGAAETARNAMREPMQKKLRSSLQEMLEQGDLQKHLVNKMAWHHENNFMVNIEQIIDNHLARLTPERVKDIIQKMIRKHLGWLVVWGGVFGGLIGLATSWI